MIRNIHRSLEWTGELIRLDDADSNDNTWFLTPEAIIAWHVDWEPQGGIITLALVDGRARTVVFEAGDQGAACSDALADLDKMRAVLRDRKERTS